MNCCIGLEGLSLICLWIIYAILLCNSQVVSNYIRKNSDDNSNKEYNVKIDVNINNNNTSLFTFNKINICFILKTV